MSKVERTTAGLQIIIPGCERRTLPTPLRSTKGQKALPKSGLFST
jgi:hypothetical protein